MHFAERLKAMNKNAERAKSRLTDECADFKKKLRDQIRTSKEIDDKYVRFKELLQRSKSTMNKLSDEISEQLKRGLPTKAESTATSTPSKPKETSGGNTQSKPTEKPAEKSAEETPKDSNSKTEAKQETKVTDVKEGEVEITTVQSTDEDTMDQATSSSDPKSNAESTNNV